MTRRTYHPVSRSLVAPESVSRSLSTYSYKPDILSGTTTFLVYYLVRELARAQTTVYFCSGHFYIFTTEGVHLIDREPDFGTRWTFTPCLVDADIWYPPSTMMSILFVLVALSSRPDDRRGSSEKLSVRCLFSKLQAGMSLSRC
jgi:hypothetical protein